MGGCLSVPDPVHGQPQQQPGGAPMPKSLCRCGWDSFMKCLFSRWCAGEFNNSTVKTTWIPPTDDRDFVPGRRAVSSRHTENSPRGVTAAITGSRDPGSDLIHRWDLELQEKHMSESEHRRKLKKAINLSDSDNSDNGKSNTLGDTDTSLVENAPKGITTASTSQDSHNRGSDLIDRLTLDPKMQELHKSQTGRGKGITLIDSDNSDNKRSNPLGEPNTSLVENSQKGVAAASTSQDSQDRGSDLVDRLDPEMLELHKSQTGGEKGIILIDRDNSDNKISNLLGDNSDNKRSNPLGEPHTSLVENSQKGVTAASTSQDSQDRGSDLVDRLDPEMLELHKSQTGGEKGINLIDSNNSDNKRSDPLGNNSDNKRSDPEVDTDTSLVENAPKGFTASSTSLDSQDRETDLIDRLDLEMQELFRSQTRAEKGITLIDSDNSDEKNSDPLDENSDNERSDPLADTDTSLVEHSQKGATAAITDSQDSGSYLINRFDLEMQELLEPPTGGKMRIALIDSSNSDNKRSNLLGGASISQLEELTNAEAVTTVTIEDKKGTSASNPNEATGVEGSEVARKNEDPSSATDKMEIK